MDRESFECKTLTEMFCYGANMKSPELRAASLKGLLRYTYRVVCQNAAPNPTLEPKKESQELLKKEGILFGSASDEQIRPSPIRLAIVVGENASFNLERKYIDNRYLVRRKNISDYKNNERPKACIKPKTPFKIQIGLLNSINSSKAVDSKNIEWYEKLLKLSLLLFGIGQRSRRGRGCISLGQARASLDTKKEILEYLKCISACDAYRLGSDYSNISVVTKEDSSSIIRPTIKEIIFGQTIEKDQGIIENYLKNVDEACHKIKEHKPRYNDGLYATGYISVDWNNSVKRPKERFSSSIIVSLAETTEGILPIYTCVKPVLGSEKNRNRFKWNEESYKEEKKAFIDLIESRGVRN